MRFYTLAKILLLSILFTGCDSKEDNSELNLEATEFEEVDSATSNETEETDSSPVDISAHPIYSKFENIIDIYHDTNTDEIVIQTKDLPNHGTPFYPDNDPLYEEYNGTNENFSTVISLGGSTIDVELSEQDYSFRIPVSPLEDLSHQSTTGGPIGITRNGIIIYNQYNGAGNLLDDLEFNNTDQYNGHPSPGMESNSGPYHHHLEPLWITSTYGNEALIGVLRDGFPIYGSYENGAEILSDDLDEYHGHLHETEDYPSGVYHYHTTSDPPWINGGAYWGSPGTVTDN